MSDGEVRMPGFDAEFEPGVLGTPGPDSMTDHPEHAIVVVWLLVLGVVRWPMLVTVLQNFRHGMIGLPPQRIVPRAAKAILIDLQRAGLVEVGPDGWRLSSFGLEWCDVWNQAGSPFAMRLAAVKEYTPGTIR